MTIHKKIYLAFFAVAFSMIPVFIKGVNDKTIFVFLGISPFLWLTYLMLSVKAIRILPKAPETRMFFILCSAIIVGGSLFDISITLIKSPDLSREANIIIAMMFDRGYSLEFIKLYNLVMQILFISTMVCILLLSCRSFELITSSINKSSILKVIPQVYAGEGKGYKEFILSKVDPLYFNASVAPIVVAVCFFRIHCGLEWLEIVPISSVSRVCVAVGLMLTTNVIYFSMIYRKLKPKDVTKFSYNEQQHSEVAIN